MKRIGLVVAILICVSGCIEGDRGPVGPPGEPGRYLSYTGTVEESVPPGEYWELSVPELNNAPPPFVQVLADTGGGWVDPEIVGAKIGVYYERQSIGFWAFPYPWRYHIILILPAE